MQTQTSLSLVVLKKRPYKKPFLQKEKGMNFPIKIINEAGKGVCKQCSGCHGCR